MKRGIQALALKGWLAWTRFWFESDGRQQMRVFQAGLGALLFVFYAIRTLDVPALFYDRGIGVAAVATEIIGGSFRYSFLNLVSSPVIVWASHLFFLASLALLSLGIAPRLSAAVALFFHISFIHRNVTAVYGVDLIANFFLLYLTIADTRRVTALGSMAFRLCQVQVCIIYAYSGLEKMRGPLWWRGEALWSVFANSLLARFDFTWLAHFPFAIAAASYVTLAWEIYFPVLVWIRPLRYWVLGFGFLLHFGIGLTMSIPFFAALMCVTYSVFIDAEHAKKIITSVKKFVRETQVPRRRSDENYV